MNNLIAISFFLCSISLFIFFILGLINPNIVGIKNRGNSIKYLLTSSIITMFMFNLIYENEDKLKDNNSLLIYRYMSIEKFSKQFDNMTDIQRNNWTIYNKDKFKVNDVCRVINIEKSDFTSVISNSDIKVTCKHKNRDVLYIYYMDDHKEIANLDKGEVIEFDARLRKITPSLFSNEWHIFTD